MFPTTCVTFPHTSLPADPKMCFRLISRECSAWIRAACPEAIKAPLQWECWDTHRDTGWHNWEHWEQVLHAPLVPRSCQRHHKTWPSRLVSFKSFVPLRAVVFWLPEGDSPPRTACVGAEERPCSGINLLCASGWGQFPGPYCLHKDICP